MKSFLLLLVSSCILQFAIAQPPAGNRPAGGNMTGKFFGKVVDERSGKGIEYASVQIISTKKNTDGEDVEEIVGGMLTQANGEFSIDNISPMGKYILKISVVGFDEYTQNISFDIKPGGDPAAMMAALSKDLGNIKIHITDQVLENVTVSASKPSMQLGIDRKIFNVDKNIVSSGGTATDIMRNIPSLNVDIDGNITMRNSTPQIFVDGRPTTLTLDQIPSDAIQSVELISNPSAKYDASGGTAGILNVVLKKEKKVGYNGNVRLNMDSRGMPGFGGDINLRQNKVNIFVSGMSSQRKNKGNGTTERQNLFGETLSNLTQKDNSVTRGNFNFLRGGVDYFINNRSTFSVTANYAKGSFKPRQSNNTIIDSLYETGTKSFLNEINANTRGTFENIGGTLGFKHNFPKAGQELTADVTYSKGKNSNNNNVFNNFFSLPGREPINAYEQLQQVRGDNNNITIQTDFVNPTSETGKLEAGLRAQIRSSNSNSAFYRKTGSDYVLQNGSLVDYESTDNVYAAYASYTDKIKDFGYMVGLRAESSNYQGDLNLTNESFDIKFPVSLFPSLFLSQKLGESAGLQLNYTRRINRPNFWQLSPFTDSTDLYNPRRGNPGLKPDFTNSVELSFENTFENKDNFIATLYYKHTDNMITRYQEEFTGSGGQQGILNTFINANSSYVTGLELIGRNNITKWWEITSNVNLYNSRVKIDDPKQPDQGNLTSWFGKINNTFKLPRNISLQLSGEYQSKTILAPGGSSSQGGGGFGGPFGGAPSAAQGYIRANYGFDFAVRYDFMKDKKANISININDIFRTRKIDMYSESAIMISNSMRRRDAQIVRVNFSYRFGKFDTDLFRRKNNKAERGGDMQGGMEGGM